MTDSQIKLINWLNRKIADVENDLKKIDPLSCSRSDDVDTGHLEGMKSAYEDVKRHVVGEK
jgi:hypothetical protein